jgi:hypothetical protein
VNVPKRMDLPVLGTEIDDIALLDKKYLANEEQFRLNADQIRQAREAQSKGSMYSLLQPFSRPKFGRTRRPKNRCAIFMYSSG